MAYTQEDNQDNSSDLMQSFNSSGNSLEDLLDLIAIALIESSVVNTSDVENNQKFIRNGQLQSGQGSGILALFQKDIKANEVDLQEGSIYSEWTGQGMVYGDYSLQIIADAIADDIGFGSISINISEDGYYNGVNISISAPGASTEWLDGANITSLVVLDGEFSNTSQFIPLTQSGSIVDVEKANEFLDTNIFELLPTGDTRQARIIRFFQELNALLPPLIEDEDWDSDGNNFVDRVSGSNAWTGSLQYQKDYSISYAQDNTDGNIDEEDAFIHRLKSTANDTNSTRTIQDIYNTVEPYLRDILEETPTPQDDRPKYQNQSSGYLQFRNPNQGIIIRNTSEDFIEGLNPESREYLNTGFTITMWVRFLDKVSNGTLFNFGNPTRGDETAFGFKLETYVLDKDDPTPHTGHDTWGDFDTYSTVDYPPLEGDIYLPIYENSNTARYVRLVVNDNGILRDSHTGIGGGPKRNTMPVIGEISDPNIALAQTTFIPEDFNEWYFICATFNPDVNEDGSFTTDDTNALGEDGIQTDPDPPLINLSHSTNYWLNHINPVDGSYEANSGFGNKCKVEIISRTDLLRARGFKVD